MKKLWKNLSETYKIFTLMLLFIVGVQLSTLLYVWRVESKVLLDKERQTLSSQLSIQAQLLEQHLLNLQKRLDFLATLEVMDDILVKDVDKRIKILLEKKAKELSENIVILAKDIHKKTIASSTRKEFSKQHLTFKVSVYASFNNKKKIGTLWLLYPYENLINLKVAHQHQKLWLTPPFKNDFFKIPTQEESISVSQTLQGVLGKWKLSLSYEKNHALTTLHEIESILLIGFLLSLLILLYIIFTLSKRQINILENTQEVLELKRTFLSTMSHELRTPLGSVLNLTQHLMVNPKMREEELGILSKIENASEHLLEMINNLLQLSKLESKSMPIVTTSINLNSLINEMVELVEPLIEEKELELKLQLPSEIYYLQNDEQIIKQIIINLLSNAIKYTNEGNIIITLHQEKEHYIFSVTDTGIGIAKERQAQLFSEFYQAHNGKKEIKHSCGLGLALSQKMAKLIGGEICIESEGVGKGCRATVKIVSLKT